VLASSWWSNGALKHLKEFLSLFRCLINAEGLGLANTHNTTVRYPSDNTTRITHEAGREYF